jgi:hypothetical protein
MSKKPPDETCRILENDLKVTRLLVAGFVDINFLQ